MKKLSKIMAIALAFAMLLSICAIGSFAEGTTVSASEILAGKYTAGTGYVAFGDSIARGYVASENWVQEVFTMDNLPGKNGGSENCRNVTGSYPLQVAQTLGINPDNNITKIDEKYWPIAQNALTSGFILDLLGVDSQIFDEEYFLKNTELDNRYETDLYYFGGSYSIDRTNAEDRTATYKGTHQSLDIRTIVNKASLITVQLGMGDIFHRAIELAMQDYAGADLSDPIVIASAAKDIVTNMYKGYEYWKIQYPLLLKYIKENNPNATTVIVGTFNPVFGMDIDGGLAIPIGNAANILTNNMNDIYEKWAEEYGFIFVDIANVETGTMANNITVTSLFTDDSARYLCSHPTYEGYAQIARMIVDSLEEKELNENPRLSNIVIDLGDVKTIEYVKIDGIKKNDYTYRDNVLTVPCRNILAGKLTVCTKSNGKSIITTYDIDYDKNGFSAIRINTINEESSVSYKITTAVNNVVSKVKSLFKKK